MKWDVKNLGDVATFSQGIQVGLEKQLTEPKEGYIRFLRIVDYTQNTDDIRYVKNPGEKYYVNEDDIIMVRYGTPGLICRGKKGVIANNLFKIKLANDKILNDYLALFLSQYKIQNYLRTQGSATMPALNFGQLKTVEILFPISLEEQQTIVSKLDQAFTAIDRAKANIEQNIQNAKELFQSKLNQIFSQKSEGWEEKKLGDISIFSQGIQVELGKQLTEPKEGYVRFIRIVDYTQNTDDIRYVANPGEKYFVNEKDIVMVRYGSPGLIGRGKKGVIANNLFRIKVINKNITNDFLVLFLSQYKIQNYLGSQGSSTMAALNFSQLKVIDVSFPKSLETQQKIVAQMDEVTAKTKQLQQKYQHKLANLEELKKSILEKAFKGELIK